MAILFKCSHCGSAVSHANLMVNGDYVRAGVEWMRVVCKDCTRGNDAAGRASEMHNLWEATWVAKSPIAMMANVLDDVARGQLRWSQKALSDFLRIVSEAHPELSRNPLPL